MKGGRRPERILAIHPTTSGFGFVVLEGRDRLVDWGLVDYRRERRERCLLRLDRLLTTYTPDVLVFEDVGDSNCRRGPRARALLRAAARRAAEHGVHVRRIKRRRVKQTWAACGAANKHQVATLLAARFPELAPRQPPVRKPWMRQDDRMSMFDSATFALAHLEDRESDVDGSRPRTA